MVPPWGCPDRLPVVFLRSASAPPLSSGRGPGSHGWGLLWNGLGRAGRAAVLTVQDFVPQFAAVTSVRGAEMATEPENQSLGPRHRRVLKVLANAPRGGDVNALLTRGFKFETMADLVRSGLATVRIETVEERGLEIEVASDHGRWRAVARRFDRAQTVAASARKTMSDHSVQERAGCGSRWIPAWGCRPRLTRPRSAGFAPRAPGLDVILVHMRRQPNGTSGKKPAAPPRSPRRSASAGRASIACWKLDSRKSGAPDERPNLRVGLACQWNF
jgi:hypothetical protein